MLACLHCYQSHCHTCRYSTAFRLVLSSLLSNVFHLGCAHLYLLQLQVQIVCEPVWSASARKGGPILTALETSCSRLQAGSQCRDELLIQMRDTAFWFLILLVRTKLGWGHQGQWKWAANLGFLEDARDNGSAWRLYCLLDQVVHILHAGLTHFCKVLVTFVCTITVWLHLRCGLSHANADHLMKAIHLLISLAIDFGRLLVQIQHPNLEIETPLLTPLILHDVRTAISTLSLNPKIIWSICCSKCYSIYPLNRLPEICGWQETATALKISIPGLNSSFPDQELKTLSTNRMITYILWMLCAPSGTVWPGTVLARLQQHVAISPLHISSTGLILYLTRLWGRPFPVVQ